jgi:short-subunit dehydrogenase
MSDARWTIITGASSGIGAEMARVFAARGYSLVLTARRGDRLAALQGELASAGVRVETIVADLEQPGAAAALLAEIAVRGITIHTLVNNAGFGLRGRFVTLPADGQLAMLQLNIVSLTELCRAVLPGLVARGGGGIINLASTASFQPVPYLGVYAATKAYVLSFSEALHEEVKGKGVTVTAVCPGATKTEFAKRADMEKSTLFKNAMAADVVARLAVDGYEAGRAIVVTGATNKVGAFGVRLMPRAFIRWAAGKLQG